MTANDSTAPETRKCLCGHNQSHHVPFPAVGDLGWYGCVECDRSDSERCKFFCAASDPPVGKDSSFEELSILLDTLRPHLYECDCAFCANWKGVSGAISRYVAKQREEIERLRNQ